MEKTIRSFGCSELAQQYFPRLSAMSAWRKFREWLDYNPRLRSLLSLSSHLCRARRAMIARGHHKN